MANPYAEAAALAAPYTGLGTQILQGANAFEMGKTKMQSEMAKQFAMQAHADLYGAQAGKAREEAATIGQRRQYQTPEFGAQIAATMNGLSPEIGQQIASGAIPQGITPEQVQSFNRGRGAHFAQLGATGDTNADQMVKAFAGLLGQGRTDQAINNPKMAATIAQGVAAGKGDALISNLGGNGVFNQFTGGQELNAVGKSSANQNNAAAGNQAAMAKLHNAQIPEVQSRIDLNKSKIGQPTVNPDGSITAPTGKPIKLSATAEKELFEADDNIKATQSTIGLLKQAKELNDKAYSGYFAKTRAALRSNLPGDSEQADATIQLDNMMTTQALESLKATFGAAPTEGERKILMDIQASADKTPKQRKDIIDRAIKASEQRAVFNTNKAKSLRSGSYNTIDPQQQPQGSDIDALLNKYGK